MNAALSLCRIRWEGRALLAPAHRAAQAFSAHQPLDRAACAGQGWVNWPVEPD